MTAEHATEDPPPVTPLARRARLAVAVSVAIATGFAAIALETVVGATRALPFWDQWEIITTQEALSGLFAQHNEHRIAFARLVFALDTAFLHGAGRASVAISLALAFLLAVTIGFIAAPDRADRTARWIASAFALCTLTSLRAWENFTWSFEVPFLAVYAFAALAFVAIVDRRSRATTLVAALVATAAAMNSVANGVLVGPLVVCLAWIAGRPKVHVVVAALSVAAMIAAYFHGYTSTEGHTDPVEALTTHPLQVLRYLCVYLGSPIYKGAGVATVVGATGIAATVWIALEIVIRRERRAAETYVLPALLCLALGTGLITALGRYGFGLVQAGSSRYATTSLLFWTCLLLERIATTRALRPRASRGFVALACALVFALAVSTPKSRARAYRRSFRILLAESAILARANDVDALHGVYESPQALVPRIDRLRTERLSIFHEPWSEWLGTPLDRHVRTTDARCEGSLDHMAIRDAVDGRAIRIEGTVSFDERFARERRVLFVDERRTIIGYGSSGYAPAPDHPAARGESRIFGFLDPRANARRVGAVVLREDASGCRIGNELELASRVEPAPL